MTILTVLMCRDQHKSSFDPLHVDHAALKLSTNDPHLDLLYQDFILVEIRLVPVVSCWVCGVCYSADSLGVNTY